MVPLPGTTNVFTTTRFHSSGGNSGGPLCVQSPQSGGTAGAYYPAGIYLGETEAGDSVVRVIDADVASLINRAELSAYTGQNYDNGVAAPLPTSERTLRDGPVGEGTVIVQFATGTPVGAGWRQYQGPSSDEAINPFAVMNNQSRVLDATTTNEIEFRAVVGYLTPVRWNLAVASNVTTNITVVYVPTSGFSNRVTGFGGAEGLRVEVFGSSRGQYVVEGLLASGFTNRTGSYNWVPVVTNTLGDNGRHTFTNEQGAPFQFFRTIYVSP